MIRLRIGEIMRDRDISSKRLSDMADLNYQTVLDLSKNRYDRIGLTVIDRLCKALEITPADLFEYDPEK